MRYGLLFLSDVREGAIVCAACGTGIHYGAKLSDALFWGVLSAALAALVDAVQFKGRLPVASVSIVALALGAGFGAWRWRGKVGFRRVVP